MNNLDVKEIREKLGMSQTEFAKKLGVALKTIQNWESGRNIPASRQSFLRSMMENHSEQNNVHGDNINGNNVTVNHQKETDKLLELLLCKEKSLATSQEQINKLLVIIDKITDK